MKLRFQSLFTVVIAGLPLLVMGAAAKPNIVFILTDDQAPDTVAAGKIWDAGTCGIRTPHMDRLYQNGTSFNRAYNMGAWTAAVCVSSRSMLVTGRFLWHAQVAEKNGYRDQLENRSFWPQRMKSAGYTTYMSGKWHVEAPVKRLFDHTAHVRLGMPKTVNKSYNRPVEGKPDTWLPWDESNGGYWEGGKHWSEVLADDAEAFIRQAAEEKAPFFMYLAFNAPHDPRQSPKSFVDMYPLEQVRVPANFLTKNPHYSAMGIGPQNMSGMRDETLAPFPRTEFAIKTHRREYQALVTHLDAQVGRIIEALADSGLSGNTYVIMTSDHGLALGRHGLMGKQNMYEHSLRVPFVITGPDIPKGRSIDTRIYMQDAMPTSLELAGAENNGVEFRSVLPLVKEERARPHESIYGAYGQRAQRAVIDGNHKMILYPADKTVMIFDLAKDPLEMNDIAARPESVEIKKRLFARLRELQKQTGDTLDLSGFGP